MLKARITLLQEFESFSDTEWNNNCQYFKVGGVSFPSCVMINDGPYFVKNVEERKASAHDEVVTLINDYPDFESFNNAYGTCKNDYEIFKRFALGE